MKKSEIEPCLGKFVNIAFTYRTKNAPEPKYINAYGHIIKIEDRNLLFKDNENYEYIVDLNKVWELTLAGKRRTAHQYRELLRKENEKLKKKLNKLSYLTGEKE